MIVCYSICCKSCCKGRKFGDNGSGSLAVRGVRRSSDFVTLTTQRDLSLELRRTINTHAKRRLALMTLLVHGSCRDKAMCEVSWQSIYT